LSISDLEAAVSSNDATDTRGFELSPQARAQADLKFTYVVTCQIYGKQKEEQKPEAADIALLMQRWFFSYTKKRNMGLIGFVFEMFIFKNLSIIILFVGDALNNYSLDI